MIAVIGDLLGRTGASRLAVAVASGVAHRGAAVQAVGVLPGDPDGDRRMLELAAAGVGHAAVLRAPGAALEPADLELALRYLPDLGVVVIIGEPPSLIAVAAAAAGFVAAPLLVVVDADGATGPLPDDAFVLGAPAEDPDDAFAGLVAELAIRLGAGTRPAAAWAETLRALVVEGRRARPA